MSRGHTHRAKKKKKCAGDTHQRPLPPLNCFHGDQNQPNYACCMHVGREVQSCGREVGGSGGLFIVGGVLKWGHCTHWTSSWATECDVDTSGLCLCRSDAARMTRSSAGSFVLASRDSTVTSIWTIACRRTWWRRRDCAGGGGVTRGVSVGERGSPRRMVRVDGGVTHARQRRACSQSIHGTMCSAEHDA